MIKPDNILKLIDEEYSVEYFMNFVQEPLNNAVESSGVKSTKVGMNLATYMMIAGAFVAVFAGMIGLYILTIFAYKFRPAVERKVKTTLDKAMYNKFIAGN
jgi:hypothetical protein